MKEGHCAALFRIRLHWGARFRRPMVRNSSPSRSPGWSPDPFWSFGKFEVQFALQIPGHKFCVYIAPSSRRSLYVPPKAYCRGTNIVSCRQTGMQHGDLCRQSAAEWGSFSLSSLQVLLCSKGHCFPRGGTGRRCCILLPQCAQTIPIHLTTSKLKLGCSVANSVASIWDRAHCGGSVLDCDREEHHRPTGLGGLCGEALQCLLYRPRCLCCPVVWGTEGQGA